MCAHWRARRGGEWKGGEGTGVGLWMEWGGGCEGVRALTHIAGPWVRRKRDFCFQKPVLACRFSRARKVACSGGKKCICWSIPFLENITQIRRHKQNNLIWFSGGI